jgi:hypothetical protein
MIQMLSDYIVCRVNYTYWWPLSNKITSIVPNAFTIFYTKQILCEDRMPGRTPTILPGDFPRFANVLNPQVPS